MNIYCRALGVEDRMLTGVLGISEACMWVLGFGVCGPPETDRIWRMPPGLGSLIPEI